MRIYLLIVYCLLVSVTLRAAGDLERGLLKHLSPGQQTVIGIEPSDRSKCGLSLYTQLEKQAVWIGDLGMQIKIGTRRKPISSGGTIEEPIYTKYEPDSTDEDILELDIPSQPELEDVVQCIRQGGSDCTFEELVGLALMGLYYPGEYDHAYIHKSLIPRARDEKRWLRGGILWFLYLDQPTASAPWSLHAQTFSAHSQFTIDE